jgi:DNA modification methylase
MKMNCTFVKVKDLKPRENNRNRHPKEQIDRLSEIIKYQGFRRPIIVSNLSGQVVCGHGRLEAAKKLGIKEVPVIYQDYIDEAQEYADHVADNALQGWSELDLSGINADLGDLGPDLDIDMLGIKDFVLEPADKLGPQCDEDEVPEYAEPRTKLGDIYKLGRHRLMCGDSTSIDDVEKLMNGELADLWLTDPPYGVGYQSNGAEDKHDKIVNDNLPMEEMVDFWTSAASNALMSCTDRAAYYWFACQGGDQMMMMMSLGKASWKVRHELIWVKDSLVMGRCDYHYKHEPILYGWKNEGTHQWFSDRKQTSVLEFPRPKRSEEHPTMKPVELIEYLIGNSSKPGQLVLDTFGGSGTTLIASEKSNRSARLMEISPKYCDIICARYERYTGKKAELING